MANAVGDSDAPQSSYADLGTSSNSEEVTYITTGVPKASRKTRVIDEDEPLVDTTAPLTLRSKKTARGKKKLHKKQQKDAAKASLINLPPELLHDILSYLTPSEIFGLLPVSRSVHDFIRENENSIARDIIRRRYWVLARCFPLPVAFQEVDSVAHAALLSEKRQEMVQIHRKPYQHIKGIDAHRCCTCMTCILAWNNLCMLLDLSYWQKNLNAREPLPIIQRGTAPEWNRRLLDMNAAIVEKAMVSRLWYAFILERHLQTTIDTLFRTLRGKKTVHPNRVYHLTRSEAEKGTDEFLEGMGPHSYEFPWMRDNYYNIETYIPNRKWSKENGRWMYYAEGLHERDLQWVKDRFSPSSSSESRPIQYSKALRELVMK